MTDFDSWKREKVLYKFDKTSVQVITNGKERIVRKEVRLNNENKSYAKYELKLMRELSHPHVVKYIHSEEIKDKLTVYMGYYQNSDLQNYLSNHDLDFKTKVKMFIDILSGMMELHSRYIIHRDIKLKNIFIDRDLRCVIGDLGIATKSVDCAKSHVGTIGVTAPEVYADDLYNEKVDIWALGIIAYQLFNQKRNGKIAFPFISPEQMRSKIIKFGDHVEYKLYLSLTNRIEPMDEQLPMKIKEMIMGMLQNDPKKRLGWVDFYKQYHLQEYDEGYRLCTFMAQYKMIEDTKQTLKEYISFFHQHKEKYFFKLQYILHIEHIDFFKQNYSQIRDNLIDIHIIHFKLMKKALDRFDYIQNKRIYKFILEWKDFFKAMKNEIHAIEHRINFRLRNDKETQIRTNPKYLKSEYFRQKLALVDSILLKIKKEDLKQMKDLKDI